MPVIAQVSDLHLSPRVPERQVQAELVIAGINAAKPDLTVITGDLTDDGWERPEDLVWAKRWMDERLDGEWFAVPGNHDVGNFAGGDEGEIDEQRVKQWREVFDPLDYGFGSTGGWIFLALNSMVFGSGLHAEQFQIERLERELGIVARAKAHLAIFSHSPLGIDRPSIPSGPTTEYWLGPAEARVYIWNRFRQAGVKLIASGHVHQTRLEKIDNTHIVWAPPASGTWVHAPGLPNPPAPDKTGFVLHHLGDDGSVRSEVVACAPMLKTVFYDPTASG